MDCEPSKIVWMILQGTLRRRIGCSGPKNRLIRAALLRLNAHHGHTDMRSLCTSCSNRESPRLTYYGRCHFQSRSASSICCRPSPSFQCSQLESRTLIMLHRYLTLVMTMKHYLRTSTPREFEKWLLLTTGCSDSDSVCFVSA